MKADRELLEMAAKAAGIVGVWHDRGQCIHVTDCAGMSDIWWRPFDDDGDALRLTAAAGIDVAYYAHHVVAWKAGICGEIAVAYGDDRAASTRRAIVRAAAVIGDNQ